MSGETPAACASGFAASLTLLPVADATLPRAEKPPPTTLPIAEVSSQIVSIVAIPQVTRPCRTPSKRISTPANQAATKPPTPMARQLVRIHQIPAAIPSVLAIGVLPALVLTVLRPTPAPSRLNKS